MARMRLLYLGPEGTFTHQAAMMAAERFHRLGDFELVALPDVLSIIDEVQSRRGWGVIAWENNVEGHVVPNLDALIDASDVAGFSRIGVDISFDAFMKRGDSVVSVAGFDDARVSAHSHDGGPGGASVAASSDSVVSVAGFDGARVSAHSHDGGPGGASVAASSDSVVSVAGFDGARVSAHSHGLAQCKRFIAEHRLIPVPASSNAAACRDLEAGQVALGPSICGTLYGLDRIAENVQDYDDAHTEFLVVAPRDEVRTLSQRAAYGNADEFETIVTFIPLVTGPGVLADLLDVVRDAGLNMTSFMSRPIKGHDGTYSFIATIDAASWEPRFRSMLVEIIEHGDWAKTLAVYPRRERPNPPVADWMLPQGGVHIEPERLPMVWQERDATRRELLW